MEKCSFLAIKKIKNFYNVYIYAINTFSFNSVNNRFITKQIKLNN